MAASREERPGPRRSQHSSGSSGIILSDRPGRAPLDCRLTPAQVSAPMSFATRVSLYLFVLAGGCSSGRLTPSADGGASGGLPQSGSAASGKLGGAAFAVKSGLFYISKGQLNFILSAEADVCRDVTSKKVPPGSLQLEVYDVPATTAGTYKSPRTQGVHVKDSCPSGAEVDKSQLEFFQSATASAITITTVNASRVDGTIDITFPDGSTVAGPFAASSCSAEPDESARCE